MKPRTVEGIISCLAKSFQLCALSLLVESGLDLEGQGEHLNEALWNQRDQRQGEEEAVVSDN